MATNPKLEDVDYQLFWREVAEAVKQVELNHGLSFTIERGTKAAYTSWRVADVNTYIYGTVIDEFVSIRIYEVEPKQPTLLVP